MNSTRYLLDQSVQDLLSKQYPEIDDELSQTKPGNKCVDCGFPLDNHILLRLPVDEKNFPISYRTRAAVSYCPMFAGDKPNPGRIDSSEFDYLFQ